MDDDTINSKLHLLTQHVCVFRLTCDFCLWNILFLCFGRLKQWTRNIKIIDPLVLSIKENINIEEILFVKLNKNHSKNKYSRWVYVYHNITCLVTQKTDYLKLVKKNRLTSVLTGVSLILCTVLCFFPVPHFSNAKHRSFHGSVESFLDSGCLRCFCARFSRI